VASFTAPPRERPGRPRRLRLHRRGSSLVVSWGAVGGAVRYLIAATLSDGRRLAFVVPASARRLSIAAVSGALAARIAVRALGPAELPGAVARASLAPVARPGRVRALRARRGAGGVLISWRRAARASAYMVLIRIPASHAGAVPLITGRLRLLSRLTLPGLRAGQSATITVAGVSATGVRGAPTTIRYHGHGARARR
jgi:hypothetical protein